VNKIDKVDVDAKFEFDKKPARAADGAARCSKFAVLFDIEVGSSRFERLFFEQVGIGWIVFGLLVFGLRSHIRPQKFMNTTGFREVKKFDSFQDFTKITNKK
jgi:hypothetical protein